MRLYGHEEELSDTICCPGLITHILYSSHKTSGFRRDEGEFSDCFCKQGNTKSLNFWDMWLILLFAIIIVFRLLKGHLLRNIFIKLKKEILTILQGSFLQAEKSSLAPKHASYNIYARQINKYHLSVLVPC